MPILDLDDLPAVQGHVLHRIDVRCTARPCPGGWFALEDGAASVLVFDADGAPLGELAVPASFARTQRPNIAVDPAAGRVGVAGARDALVVDRGGEVRTITHPAWNGFAGGDLAFDPSEGGRDRLWLVAPSAAVTGLTRQPPSGVVSLVDASTGAVLDTLDLDDGYPEGYTMLVAPGLGAVLNGAYGQDGSMTWCLRTDGDRIEAQPFGHTGVASSFDAARREILFMPHDDEDVEARTWWTGETTARALGADLFGSWDEQEDAELDDEPDGFDYVGCFLDDDRIVTLTRSERALVLDRGTGRPRGRLVVGGDDVDAVVVEQVAPGRLLCSGSAVTLVAVDD